MKKSCGMNSCEQVFVVYFGRVSFIIPFFLIHITIMRLTEHLLVKNVKIMLNIQKILSTCYVIIVIKFDQC